VEPSLTRGQFVVRHLLITLAVQLLMLVNPILILLTFATALFPLTWLFERGKTHPIGTYLLSALISFLVTLGVAVSWFIYLMGTANWR
jgi:hypothetical protein